MENRLKDILTIGLVTAFLLGLGCWGMIKPVDEISVSERRKLAKFPTMTKEAVADGSFMRAFESYSLDQFPLRERFRTLKSIVAYTVMEKKDNNDIYVEDGYAVQLEPKLDMESLAYAAKRFQFVYDLYLKESDAKVYVSIIPDKNYFLAKEHEYPVMDYAKLTETMTASMDYAKYIDIMSELELADYYKTDTHWRQEKILKVAQKIADGMGTTLTLEYSVKELDAPFYGVYYGQSALPMKAEKLCYMEQPLFKDCRVFDYETQKEGTIYDMERAYGLDAYEIFLSGPKSLLTIENPNATTDKELIVFRDSFGSSIAPYFAEGYQKITLVDIRYLSPQLLKQFVEFDEQDVLFLYSTSVLNHSNTIK
ncbi:MAG: DHHW family protein [Eubacteriales bacterium]|nr:DHHW family protein [Eubacteriales bacterium]